MIIEEIKLIEDEIISMYKDLHQHPEIGFAEHRTSEIIANYLRECGIEVEEKIAITGVVGVLDSGKPGKTVMLRADMDCLEIQELSEHEYKSLNDGQMHACGHDAHVTMLLAAAKILSKKTHEFKGRIKFVFQPSEEGTPKTTKETVRDNGYNGEGGAGFMVKEGVLNDVDACLIMHVQPSLKTGTISISKKNACASSDNFNITIIGRGGHGAQPQNAIDPVPAAIELISAIHLLPSREVSALETVVFSVGNIDTPGSVWNAVAEKVVISGGFRTFNQKVRELLKDRILDMSQNIANAHRCTVEFNNVTGYKPCLNDEKLAIVLAENSSLILNKDNVIFTDKPAMTSEDASEYLDRVPGVFYWLGVGENENSAPLHNPYFKIDLDALQIGTMMHVSNSIALLNLLNNQ